MKLFFGEFKPDYSKYHFPYQVWLLKEEKDNEEKIYENGFLPMRHLKDVYYLSRSLRVNLNLFEPTSENRRILKKTENYSFEMISLSDFKYDLSVQRLCKSYSEEKIGKGIIRTSSIEAVFTNGIFNKVFVFKERVSRVVVGYAVCFVSDSLLHYAHSFYDLKHYQDNLGMGMMLSAIVWAKENQKKYGYLGTCYEEKALYKTEFKEGEFFNGFKWSGNSEELKELIKEGQKEEEGQEEQEYLLKRKEFLGKFYLGDLKGILSNYGVRVNF